jgi:hypothetical protein
MGSEGVCSCGGSPVLQPVTATCDCPKGALLPLLLAEPRTLLQRIRDHFATYGSEPVVVKLEHGKAMAVCEERHDEVDAASAAGVVGEVELVRRGVRFKGVAERTERKWDLVDEPVGQHVGKVGDLCWQGRLVELLHITNDER